MTWHRAVTLVWFPVQFALLVAMLWYVPRADHLDSGESIALFFGMGVLAGTIGINYSHELMHQKSKLERWLADLLLASCCIRISGPSICGCITSMSAPRATR
jgi:alkane 1-monooxygenase